MIDDSFIRLPGLTCDFYVRPSQVFLLESEQRNGMEVCRLQFRLDDHTSSRLVTLPCDMVLQRLYQTQPQPAQSGTTWRPSVPERWRGFFDEGQHKCINECMEYVFDRRHGSPTHYEIHIIVTLVDCLVDAQTNINDLQRVIRGSHSVETPQESPV